MVSNHRLVLFTHAPCRLSYPAACGPLGEGFRGDVGLAALPRVRAKNALGGRTFDHIRFQSEGSGMKSKEFLESELTT
jgi:hypothetical protein